LGQFAGDYETARKYYIPQGEAWFKLEEPGSKETFYLLASSERLNDFEDLLKQYQSADAAGKPDLEKGILAKIRELRRQHKEFSSPAERPVDIGGAIRGIEKTQGEIPPDVSAIAAEITSSGFFARTFSIEHQ
jgi:hypothetical protein